MKFKVGQIIYGCVDHYTPGFYGAVYSHTILSFEKTSYSDGSVFYKILVSADCQKGCKFNIFFKDGKFLDKISIPEDIEWDEDVAREIDVYHKNTAFFLDKNDLKDFLKKERIKFYENKIKDKEDSIEKLKKDIEKSKEEIILLEQGILSDPKLRL